MYANLFYMKKAIFIYPPLVRRPKSYNIIYRDDVMEMSRLAMHRQAIGSAIYWQMMSPSRDYDRQAQ